ncbi:hypothetical protein BLOT_016807 [Blomia tropicalis]|nr:hypothetical protein BLOT_016807 [Blomia tropicalis]
MHKIRCAYFGTLTNGCQTYGPLVGVSSFLVENTGVLLVEELKPPLLFHNNAKLSANTNKISEKLMETSLQREVKDIRLSENEMSVLSNFKDNFDDSNFITEYVTMCKHNYNTKIKLLGLCYNNPVIFDSRFFYIYMNFINSGQIQHMIIEEFEENCFQFIHDKSFYF